jgi:hypothetical protein
MRSIIAGLIYGYEKAKSLLIETKLIRFLEVSGNLKSG